MERAPFVHRGPWAGLGVLILAGAVIVSAVQGQSNVAMIVTGTVRWGDSRGQVTPPGYSKGEPIHGIDVIAFLVKGTDIHGLPITKILANTTTDEAGRYTLRLSVDAAERFVHLMAVNSWGEGRKSLPVAAGTFTVDLSVDFGHLAYGKHVTTSETTAEVIPTQTVYVQQTFPLYNRVIQVGAGGLVAWQAMVIIACIAIGFAVLLKYLRD